MPGSMLSERRQADRSEWCNGAVFDVNCNDCISKFVEAGTSSVVIRGIQGPDPLYIHSQKRDLPKTAGVQSIREE